MNLFIEAFSYIYITYFLWMRFEILPYCCLVFERWKLRHGALHVFNVMRIIIHSERNFRNENSHSIFDWVCIRLYKFGHWFLSTVKYFQLPFKTVQWDSNFSDLGTKLFHVLFDSFWSVNYFICISVELRRHEDFGTKQSTKGNANLVNFVSGFD